MKGFVRSDLFLSLCGLNCGLCPMRVGGYCGGCGNGNQSCAIARCSMEQGSVEYCFACPRYPCERYRHDSEWDSFISYRNQRADLEKARAQGIDAYHREQEEKVRILEYLLSHWNDGRRKTLFCTAVNLLSLPGLREVLAQLQGDPELSARSRKEQAAYAAALLSELSRREGVPLGLRRKKKAGPNDG